MSNFKKTAAAILAVALMGTALPFSGSSSPLSAPLTASAADQSTKTALNDSLVDGVLTLSGNVVRAEVRDFEKKKEVEKIVCAENTVLPADCSSLFAFYKATEIDLSNADTSGVTSMKSMFYECGNLVKLDISSFDTSNVKSMFQMFSNCSKLESLDVSHFNTSNVTDMSWMFHNCRKVPVIDVSGFDTSNVKDMSYMFSSCIGITSLDLSSFNTSSVKKMTNMFDSCTGLTSLDLGSFNTENVTTMYGMFIGCTGLTSLDLSPLDTSNVTSMIHMFTKCTSLSSLDLSNLDTSSLTEVQYMFSGCSGLTSLDLSGFDTQNVKNMYQMFSGCSNLTSLDLSGLNTSKVENMREMFADCKKLASLDLSSFDTSNVTTMRNMFDSCAKLTSLDLSNFNTSKVTDMAFMFDDCQMTSLDLSSFDTSSVTNMSNMFRRCTALESVDVSSFNTENVTDIGGMFIACLKLRDVDLSGFDMKNVEKKGSMLGGCDKLKPDMVYAMYNNTTLNGTINLNFHIQSCDNLAKVVLSGPNGNITFTDISDHLQDSGLYQFTYPLNSDQSYKEVTLAAYNSDGRKLLVCTKDDAIADHCQASRTLDSYLEELLADSSAAASVTELAQALRSYCICAKEYFHNTAAAYDVPTLSDADLNRIEESIMKDETGKCKISLVLNSGTSIRIYHNGNENTAKYGTKELKAQTSKYGKYFEIPNVRADQLNDTYTITIGGKKVTFSALSYVQRVFNMSDADPKLDTICRMLCAYGRAAENYKAEQEA